MRPLPTLLALLVLATPAWSATPADGAEIERTLALIRQWVHGQYNNQAQFDDDLARGVPDNEMHRVMHQLFVPVSVGIPALGGYLVFQQASADGSNEPDTIMRAGLLQFLPDPLSGAVIQRELNFRDIAPWKNAHLDQQRLRGLTLADFRVDSGCDFLLRANAAGTEVSGPIRKDACRMKNPGSGKDMVADDMVVIRADQYAFRGKFRDAETGRVVWGTESAELNTLSRVSSP